MLIHAILISLLYFMLLVINERRIALPDSKRYISGERLHSPFHLRFLLPMICRQNEMLWNIFTLTPIILIPILTYVYLIGRGFSETQSLLGCALCCGLAGVIAINYIAKYLSDGMGICFMMASVIMFQYDYVYLGILFSLIGSTIKENVFIYSALISWHPLALIGCISPLLRHLLYRPNKNDLLNGESILKSPLRTGLNQHKERFLDLRIMLLTWGGCLWAIWGTWSLQDIITVGIAYGSVLMATDRQRLYQMSFPLVIALAVSVIPYEYILITIILHWFNPWRITTI